MSHTWIRNPDTDGVWACPDGVLPVFAVRGWVPCEDPTVEAAPELPAAWSEKPKSTNPSKAAKRGQTTAKEL